MLFGGSHAGSAPSYFSDTWLWDSTTWAPLYTPGGVHPPERYAFGMAYDPSRGVLIYGALDISDSVTLNDMWSLTPWGRRLRSQLGSFQAVVNVLSDGRGRPNSQQPAPGHITLV